MTKQQLKKLVDKGLSDHAISVQLGVSRYSVIYSREYYSLKSRFVVGGHGNKSKKLGFRVTDEEEEIISRKAGKASKSVADYCRDRALEK